MPAYNSFEVPFDYSNTDKYIRAIRFNMLRRNGEVKAGAFKSKKGGVFVTRSNDLLMAMAMSYMKVRFEGVMAVFPKSICDDTNIFEKHSPSPGHNLHHWELYGNIEYDELTEEQIDALIDTLILAARKICLL